MPDNNPIPISDGNITPNDGADWTNGTYYPGTPEGQDERIAAEQAPAAGSYPIMLSVFNWFQAEIDLAGDIDQIETSQMTVNGVRYSRTVSIEAQVLAQQILKKKLSEKQNEWAAFAPEDES